MRAKCIFYGIIATWVLLFAVACTDDYPDDYGFTAFIYPAAEQTDVKLRPDGYDITLKTQVYYDEGTGITKYGYSVNGEETACEFVKTSQENGYLVITLSDLEYGKHYSVYSFMGDDEYVETGGSIAVCYNKEDCTPVFVETTELSMNAAEGIVLEAVFSCLASGYIPVTSATAKLGTRDIAATVSSDGTRVRVSTGSINTFDEGEYSKITITVANDFGSRALSWTYSATVSKSSGFYRDDGNKSDCIRLCGIDWAKGNFVVSGGKARIQSGQWVVEPHTTAYNNGAFFEPANGKTSVLKSAVQVNGYQRASLKGMAGYDVVPAYLDGWCTPSSSDFTTLLERASVQQCKVLMPSGESVSGLLFLSPGITQKRFTSTSGSISVRAEDVDALGLFLPACGMFYRGNMNYSKGSYSNENYLYYLTSTVIVDTYASDAQYYRINSTEHYYNNLKNSSEIWVDFEHSTNLSERYYYAIRPVKLQ